MDTPWTPALVEAEIRAALVTLRRIPSKHLFPAGIRSSMPEVVRGFWEAYNPEPARKPRVQATAQDIQRMDDALGWIWSHLSPAACLEHHLPEDAAAIVLMRCSGMKWEWVGEYRLERWIRPKSQGRTIPGGNSYPRLRQHFTGALEIIVRGIGGVVDPEALAAPPRPMEWGVNVEVAREGQTLGESDYLGQPVVARAKWGVVRR